MPMTPLNGDAENVAEINDLADELRRRSAKFVPYVRQDHGGVAHTRETDDRKAQQLAAWKRVADIVHAR
jgi:hypothetical protein